MKTEHYAGIIFWQDGPELLQQTILAAKAIGLKVIAIDGCYQEFMKFGQIEKPYSTDGCIDVAKAHADIFIESPSDGWGDQMIKRNKYIELTPLGHYFWYIDADEVLRKQNVNLDKITLDIYRLMENRMLSERDQRLLSPVRVYRKYEDIANKYQHSRMYRLKEHRDGDLDSGLLASAHGAMNSSYPILMTTAAQPVTFDHYNYKRSDERKRQKQNFYRMREETKIPW